MNGGTKILWMSIHLFLFVVLCFGDIVCLYCKKHQIKIHATVIVLQCYQQDRGVQWLSGRVLDSRLRGRGFKPHWRRCVVVLEQDTFILAKYWFNPGRPVPV